MEKDKRNERNLVFLSAIAIFLLFLPIVNASGLGIGPVNIEIKGAMRGYEYKNMLFVQNSFENETTFLLNVIGNCSEWISLYPFEDQSKAITNITIPAMSEANLLAKFKIPENAPAGNYICSIYAQQAPRQGGEGQTLMLRVKSEVRLEVIGGDIPSGIIRGVTIVSPEIGQPLVIEIVFQNTGDVTATPLIVANITKNGTVIDKINYNQTSVEPGNTKIIKIEKSTSGWEIGSYEMPTKVFLAGVIYDRDNLGFKILEQGSTTSSGDSSGGGGGAGGSTDSSTGENKESGNLKTIQISVSYEGKILNVTVPGKINLGDMVKTEIIFSNTGNANLRARAKAEIYSNGKFVSVIQGDEILLKAGETRTFTLYFKPEEVGKYQIKPSVVYEGKEIAIDPVSFTVSNGISMPTGMTVLAPGIGILGIIIVVVAIVLWNKKKQKQQYVVRKRWGH